MPVVHNNNYRTYELLYPLYHFLLSTNQSINFQSINPFHNFGFMVLFYSRLFCKYTRTPPGANVNHKPKIYPVFNVVFKNSLSETNPEPKIRFSALYIHLYTPPHLRNINKIIVILLVNIVKFKPNYFFRSLNVLVCIN